MKQTMVRIEIRPRHNQVRIQVQVEIQNRFSRKRNPSNENNLSYIFDLFSHA